ncbi:MAG: polymer-forming cytoskeletal protein [Bdellovibrionales bacterium]|nr:polymer-forming cytoskeletal protein [Bdellovibrionales bacterium]MBL7689493.1 polymer-forming cytoskeletal protein [Pseudobdellovibrionaceae bacterium]
MGEVESGKTRKSDRIFPSLTSDEALTDGRLTALLDEGASFEGKLSFEGVVRIGGNFRGEIFTRDTLVINPGATVEAEVEADIVVISGTFVGSVSARKRVIMHPPAIFRGTVTTPSLRIDEGVTFEGASYMPKES